MVLAEGDSGPRRRIAVSVGQALCRSACGRIGLGDDVGSVTKRHPEERWPDLQGVNLLVVHPPRRTALSSELAPATRAEGAAI